MTIFEQVSPTELPKHSGYYFVIYVSEATRYKNINYFDGKKFTGNDEILYWLREVPNMQELMNSADEREVMAQAFEKVRELFAGREWLMEGRGNYPYNDDRYKEEVRYMMDAFNKIKSELWRNVKSKTADYRQRIIKEYIQEQESLKEK